MQAPYSSPAEASDAWQQPPPSTTQRCISAAFHLVLDNTDKHYQEGTRHVPNMYVNTWSALLKAAVFVWPVDLATSAAQVLKAIFRLSFKAGWQLLKSLLDILVNMCRLESREAA